MRRIASLTAAWREYDWVLTTVVFILTAIGLAAIYSVDLSQGSSLLFFPRQCLAAAIGLGVFFIAGALHATVYRASARLFYLGAAILLIAVLLFGVTIRGTTGWFRFAGFSFQPAEFAKVALVIFLGFVISRYGRRFDKIQFVIGTGLVTLFPILLIMLQPDLGSAFVLGSVWFGVLWVTGAKKRYLIAIMIAGFLAFLAGWFFLFEDYQKNRLLTFIDPGRDPLNTGYNVTQSIIAVGSGQLYGRGLGFGSQSQLHFLPEAQTDFIFSVIAEELGFIGVLVVLILFFVLAWRLLHIALQAPADFGAYVVLGIALLFFTQSVVNIGGATGLLPVTGVTLPFLSYGGSSLIINFFLLGVAQSIKRTGRRAIYS